MTACQNAKRVAGHIVDWDELVWEEKDEKDEKDEKEEKEEKADWPLKGLVKLWEPSLKGKLLMKMIRKGEGKDERKLF